MAVERRTRPLERFWPYAEQPEEPTAGGAGRARSGSARGALRAARSAVFDHARVSAVRRATDYARAVEMARQSAEYREVGAGERLPPSRALLSRRRAARCAICSSSSAVSPSTEVLIDDRPIPYARELWLPLVWFLLLSAKRPIGSMPPQGQRIRPEMQQLEAEIKRLEAEYNMFFAGRLPRLPWETRARVEALVKRYDRMHLTQHRASAFASTRCRRASRRSASLWERALKAKEEGRPARGRPRPAPAATAATRRRAFATQPRRRHHRRRPAQLRQRTIKVAKAQRQRRPRRRDSAIRRARNRSCKSCTSGCPRRARSGRAADRRIDRFADVVQAQVDKLGGDERRSRVSRRG